LNFVQSRTFVDCKVLIQVFVPNERSYLDVAHIVPKSNLFNEIKTVEGGFLMKESKHPSLFNALVFQAMLALIVTLMFVPSSFAADTIKIGQLDPASGTFKTTGDQYNAAIEQAVFDINQKGGVLGKKVELIWLDGMMKPEVATRQALRLIQKDKVDFLVGGTGSHVYLALEKLADQYKKIVVCTGATSDDLTGKGFSRYFFRPGITNTNTTFSIAKYLAKQPYTKYYSIHQDYAFGHDMARIFREKLTSLNPNAKIVGEDFTPVGNKDYNRTFANRST